MPFCLPHARLHLHRQKIGFRLVRSSSNFPQPLPAVAALTPEHEREARAWLSTFQTTASIPKHLVELSFCRSSGPGGQVEYLIAP